MWSWMSGRLSALVSATGMLTSPNAIDPFQIARAITTTSQDTCQGAIRIQMKEFPMELSSNLKAKMQNARHAAEFTLAKADRVSCPYSGLCKQFLRMSKSTGLTK